MHIVCADMEGIFTPEIWINVAEITGIEELRLTTRDISDYDVLMRKRLGILEENKLKLKDIQNVIATMEPLEGAQEFLNWLRSLVQVIIVSDTYVEFAGPLIEKLGWPTLFCNTLTIDSEGMIADYNLRQQDGKQKVAKALQALNYSVIAIGDSYNDITMLKAADNGILFRPPDNVKEEYAEFPVAFAYDELEKHIKKILKNSN
ncbi:MAG: bifunctional phosphoserine phosphatase/homoserine phosphotransferase ThrH [Deltaproteobacteria bacterium]|jgi:phosphoserine/homoserine phosphotransferase|nr:bifunctional phosphoserine phosphatase/homoserine phosphotransferase ThrH [Deltaproteobacteria bacterium]